MSGVKVTPGQAKKSYMARMLGASLGYIGTIIGAVFVIDKDDPVSLVTIAVAALPGIFIILMVRAVWRFIREVDEVARHDYTQAMMNGLFAVLALSGSWGLIELFHEGLPRLPVFWIFPIFFMIFGLASCFRFGRWA